MSNVLLIEPNVVLAATYVAFLQQKGYMAIAVTSAQAAIDAADEHMPDIVVVELQLTGHNGIEFLHEFRSYPEWQRIPVVVHTMLPPSHLAGLDTVMATDLGVCAILYKPATSLEDLARTVRTTIGQP